jgi:hypothetical protein
LTVALLGGVVTGTGRHRSFNFSAMLDGQADGLMGKVEVFVVGSRPSVAVAGELLAARRARKVGRSAGRLSLSV